MANNIAVSISVDTADLQVKRAIMSAELKAATKDLNTFAKEAATSGSTEALREGMLASATAAEKARASIAQVNVELAKTAMAAKPAVEHLEHGFAGASVSIREAGVQLRESFAFFGEMREAALAFGEAMLAAFAVEQVAEFSRKMGESAEKTTLMAERLGITVADTQRLGAMAQVTQSSIDDMAKGMQKLDVSLQKAQEGSSDQGAAFRSLGIDTNRSYTQMGLLTAVMGKFADLDNGPHKVALAMTLFGKAGASLIPILSASREQQEEFNRSLAQYGVINESAVAKGNALAEAWDSNELAVLGLKNVMADGLAPVLTEMVQSLNAFIASVVQSYREGGAAKIAFEGLSGAMQVAGSVIATVSDVFSAITANAIVPLVATLKTLAEDAFPGVQSATGAVTQTMAQLTPYVREAANILMGGLAAAAIYYGGTAAIEAATGTVYFAISVATKAIPAITEMILSLRAGAIPAMIAFGTAAVAAATEATVAFLAFMATNPLGWIAAGVGVVVAGFAHFSGILDPIIKKLQEIGGWIVHFLGLDKAVADIGKIWSGPAAAPPPIAPPKIGTSGIAESTKKPKKAKAAKDDLVQKLDAELTAKKLAWEKENNARGTAIAFSLQVEADYWSKILQRTDLSAKDRTEIEKKYLAVHGQIVKERIAIVIDGYRQELAEADKNAAAKLEIADRELAFIGKTFGLESKEYAQSRSEIVRIEKEAAQQLRDLDDIRDKGIDKANLDHIAAQEATAKQRVALGVATNAQLLAQQRAFEDARYAIERAAAVRARAGVDPSKDPVKAKQLNLQLEQIERDHQAKVTAIDQQAALDRRRIAQQTFKPFADSLAQMVTLQKGFMSTINDMWRSFGNLVSQVITKWTENFLVALVTQEVAAERAHLKQVVHLAKQAAAGAYNAVVGIPVIGPILAPIAAATAFVGVMAFSAEGGMDRVPYDGAPIIAHKDEMVLSARYANPLREMLSGGGWTLPASTGAPGSLALAGSTANGNAPFAANKNSGGDTHNWHYNDYTEKGQSEAEIMAKRHVFAKAMKRAHREGHFAGSPINF